MSTNPSRLQGPRQQLVSAAAKLAADFDALAAHPKTRFYASPGVLTLAFILVEAQSFDIPA